MFSVNYSFAQTDTSKQINIAIDSLNNQKEKPDTMVYYRAKVRIDSVKKVKNEIAKQDSILNINAKKTVIETKLDKLRRTGRIFVHGRLHVRRLLPRYFL